MHLKIPKTSENFQRRAKSSGDTCSGSGNSPDISQAQSWKCITKRDFASSAFYLKKEVSSFTQNFHFSHQFEFTYFWKLCQAKLQPLTHTSERIWPINVSQRKIKVFNLQA